MFKKLKKSLDSIFFFLRLVFCSFFLPCTLSAQTLEIPPHPWSLEAAWWKELTKSRDDQLDERVDKLITSLQRLETQVPEESRDLVRASVEAISKNTDQFLSLVTTKGWKIEPAPTPLDLYSMRQLLDVAKHVKEDKSDLLGTTSNLDKLHILLQQARAREDALYAEYIKTTERSLQRTLTGLRFMISVTSRAVLEEKTRILQEKKSGIEERSNWNKNVLNLAQDRLSQSSIDLPALHTQISEASEREKSFQKDLLHIEGELVSNGLDTPTDDHLLIAITKLTAYSRDQVVVIAGYAQKKIFHLLESQPSPDEANVYLKEAKEWLKELGKIEQRALEWNTLVRREQYATERFLADEKTSSPQDYRNYLSYQRAVQKAFSELNLLEVDLFQAQVLAELVLHRATENLHWLSNFWERSYFLTKRATGRLLDWFSHPLFRINERAVTLFKILRAFFILFLAYGISFFLQRMLSEFSKRKPYVSNSSLYTFKRVTHYTILFVGIVWSFSSIGIDFSNLLIIAGALSVGIGFGLQGIVNNFLGGLIVLFDQKLRVGDFIELSGGETGHITGVNVQNTVIRTPTGHDILVPNSDIITHQLTNWTLRDHYARIHVPFGVAYGSDKEKVKSAVEQAARKVLGTVTQHKSLPDPNVWLVGFGDSSLNFELVTWVDFRKMKRRQSSLRAAYYWEIETALVENGIEIPFPQRDIHLQFDPENRAESIKK